MYGRKLLGSTSAQKGSREISSSLASSEREEIAVKAHATPAGAILLLLVSSPGVASTFRHDVGSGPYETAAAEFSSIGALLGETTGGSTYLCSGTLIDNSTTDSLWVLTAAHCVDDATTIDFGTDMSANGGVSLDGEIRSAISWHPHPDWNGDLSKGNDIGLIELAGDPINGVDVPALFTGSDERGMVGTSVGFGLTGSGNLEGLENRELDGKKRVNVNDIDVHFVTRGPDNDYFGMDFDSPDGTDSSWGESFPNSLEGGTLFGDSGGGTFVDVSGDYQVAGVNSFISAPDGIADADYGDRSGHTRVSLYVDWINDLISGGSGGGGDDEGRGGGPPPWAGGPGGPNSSGPLAFLDEGAVFELGHLDGRASGAGLHGVGVPEPSTALLAVLGLIGALISQLRRRC
jgi:hypothetical protein